MMAKIQHGLIAALFSMSLPTSAHAFGLKRLPKSLKMQRKAVAESDRFPNCTDFSGHWEGSCQYTDGSEGQSSITIAQDSCKKIVIDGFDSSVPGVSKSSDTSFVDNEQIDVTGAFDWNTARKTLLIHAAAVIKGANSTTLVTGDSTMSLVDGQLLTTQNSTTTGTFKGTPSSETYTEECKYTKQNL